MCGLTFVLAITALVRTNVDERRVELEEISDSHCRLTLSKESIGSDVMWIDVIPDFMTARKGDSGYWLDARGAYGRFDRECGGYENDRAGWMPIFGLKKGDSLWYGQVIQWRCDYRFRVEATNGVYRAYPRFCVAGVREYYPPYQDIVVDYRRLDGAQADYVGYAKAYRKYQFENSGIRMDWGQTTIEG